MSKRNVLILFFILGLVFSGIVSKYTSKPDIIDAIEGDPDVIGNISPSNFDKIDDLKDQNLNDNQKIQKAQQILKSDSGVKDMADTIIRRVSSGSIDITGKNKNSESSGLKLGSPSGSVDNIGSGLSSRSLLSKIRTEFETNYDNMYSTLDSKAKEVADELMTEFQDTELSLTDLTENVKSIISESSSNVQQEIKNLIPSELNLDSVIKNTKSSISEKIVSIKNGIKSIFSKQTTTDPY